MDTSLTTVERHGRMLLLYLFLALLAGRYAPGGVDLRFPLAVAGLGGASLWLSVAKIRTAKVSLAPYIWWFLAYVAWMAMSAGWAPDGARTADGLIDLGYLAVLVTVSVVVASRLSTRALSSLWTWLAVTGVIYLALALISGPDPQGRFSVPGGGPNVFVRVMTLAALGALYLAIVRHKSWSVWLLPLFLGGAVLSGSRGGVAALVLVIAVGALPLVRRTSPKIRRRGVVGVAAGGVLAWVTIGPTIVSTIVERFFRLTLIEEHFGHRDVIADWTIAIWRDHPFAGAGLDAYYALTPGYEYPHNVALATAAEGGVVGLALLACALGAVVAVARRRRAYSGESLFAGLAALAILAASMFSGDYYDTRFMWFFVGLALIEIRNVNPAAASSSSSRQSLTS